METQTKKPTKEISLTDKIMENTKNAVYDFSLNFWETATCPYRLPELFENKMKSLRVRNGCIGIETKDEMPKGRDLTRFIGHGVGMLSIYAQILAGLELIRQDYSELLAIPIAASVGYNLFYHLKNKQNKGIQNGKTK